LAAHVGGRTIGLLEPGHDRALICAYDAATADRLEAMEAPLFARFEFLPIARQDLIRTRTGGLNVGWTLIVGPFLHRPKRSRSTCGLSASRRS